MVDLFEESDFRPQKPTAEALPVAGSRLRRPGDRISIDLFCSLDDAYDEIASRLRWHPFGPDDQRLPFMSAEDVVAFKLSSHRDKDWVDIRKVLDQMPWPNGYHYRFGGSTKDMQESFAYTLSLIHLSEPTRP